MRRIFAFLLFMMLCAVAHAQTTVANFDSPFCGNPVLTYQGINFSASPWDCESAGLSGDATKSLSWSKQITVGTFSFVSPAVLVSLRAGGSGSGGTLTITTDAGERFTASVVSGSMSAPLPTKFVKSATLVTVNFTGGWAIELDDLTYQPSVAPPPPPTPPTITSQPASITVIAGQTATFSVTATGTAPLAYQWQRNTLAVAGANSASYTTPPTISTDNGSQFTATVNNQAGSVTSTAAVLTVNTPPPPPPATFVSKVTYDNGTALAGLARLYQEASTETLLATATLDATGKATFTTALSSGSQYRLQIVSQSGASLVSLWSLPFGATLNASFIQALATNEVDMVLRSVDNSVKSMGLSPR